MTWIASLLLRLQVNRLQHHGVIYLPIPDVIRAPRLDISRLCAAASAAGSAS